MPWTCLRRRVAQTRERNNLKWNILENRGKPNRFCSQFCSLKLTWAQLLHYPHSLSKGQTCPKGFCSPTIITGDCQSMHSADSAGFVHYSIFRCTLLTGGLCSALLKEEKLLTLPDTHPWPRGAQALKDVTWRMAWWCWHHGNGGTMATVIESATSSTQLWSSHTKVLPAAVNFFEILYFIFA